LLSGQADEISESFCLISGQAGEVGKSEWLLVGQVGEMTETHENPGFLANWDVVPHLYTFGCGLPERLKGCSVEQTPIIC
jgi:hypothetical protein